MPYKPSGLACLRTAVAGIVLLWTAATYAQEGSERPAGEILLSDQLERIQFDPSFDESVFPPRQLQAQED